MRCVMALWSGGSFGPSIEAGERRDAETVTQRQGTERRLMAVGLSCLVVGLSCMM